jgi:SP family general alpha glucoside:H+ symporter-like MFS transporter
MWPVPLFIGIAMAPESPWWLIRHDRTAAARKSLTRLSSNPDAQTIEETIDMMRHTTQLEMELTTGASYLDCFRGVNLRRTEIVCMVWAIQVLSGNSFSNYSTYFLVQAGLNSSNSYSFALGQYGFNVIGVFGAWGLMALGLGRRKLFIGGLCGLCLALFVMGCMSFVKDVKAASLAAGVMMLVWVRLPSTRYAAYADIA